MDMTSAIAPDSEVSDNKMPQPRIVSGAENLMPTETAASQGMEGESTRVSKVEKKKPPPDHPPTSEMVVESIRRLKKRNGASAEAICRDIEDNYDVNMKALKSHINRFLKIAVQKGILDQVSGAGGKMAFKIKKENSKMKILPKVSSMTKVKSVPKMKSAPKGKSDLKGKRASKRKSVPKGKSAPKEKSALKGKSVEKVKSVIRQEKNMETKLADAGKRDKN